MSDNFGPQGGGGGGGGGVEFNPPTTNDANADNQIGTTGATKKGLIVQGSPGQSTPIFEVQKSDGTPIFYAGGTNNPVSFIAGSAGASLDSSAGTLLITGNPIEIIGLGGSVTITATGGQSVQVVSDSVSSGNGGGVSVSAGHTTDSSGSGGNATLTGGNGKAAGGGTVYITGGDSTAGDGSGGNVNITAGSKNGSGADGLVNLGVTGGSKLLSLDPAANLVNLTNLTLGIEGSQVVGAKDTGWVTPTNGDKTVALDGSTTYTVSASYDQTEVQAISDALTDTRKLLAALILSLRTHGMIGS